MKIMTIERYKEFTIGSIWWLFAPRVAQWLKPKLGQGGTVRITISHPPTK